MNEQGRNEADISRYIDVEYSPEGYKTVYRWGDFLEIAGGHVYNAMDTIDLVLAGGEYEGFNPRYAYTCEFVGCSTLIDGIALFRPVSRDGEDLTQIAFLRSDIDDDTGAYTERFEAGSFDIAAASDIQCSDLGIDLLDYFRGRSFEGLSGVKRGLDGREAVVAVEVATGCDLDLFEDFWLGSPGETDVHVGPYVKRDLIALSYNDLFDEISCFDRMLRDLKCGDDPEHPTEISVVAKGTVERWDRPSRGLVVADSLLSLIQGTGSADALRDCQIDRIVDTNGELHIEASHHDGSAYLDVRLISGVSYDAKGFKLGGEYCAPGKMSTGNFHILLDNIYDSPDVGPCSLPRFAERAYGTARESYRFGETRFDIYQVAGSPDLPYMAKISTGDGACEDAGLRFASVCEAKTWCHQYSLRELAETEKKPEPAEAAAAAKRAAGCTGGDDAGNAGAIKL